MDTFLSWKTKDVPDITNKGAWILMSMGNKITQRRSIGNQEVENITVRGVTLLELIKSKRNQDLW